MKPSERIRQLVREVADTRMQQMETEAAIIEMLNDPMTWIGAIIAYLEERDAV